jgi:hypothetical protein
MDHRHRSTLVSKRFPASSRHGLHTCCAHVPAALLVPSPATPCTVRRARLAQRSPTQPNAAQRSPTQPNAAQHSPTQPNAAHHSPTQPNAAQRNPSRPSARGRPACPHAGKCEYTPFSAQAAPSRSRYPSREKQRCPASSSRDPQASFWPSSKWASALVHQRPASMYSIGNPQSLKLGATASSERPHYLSPPGRKTKRPLRNCASVTLSFWLSLSRSVTSTAFMAVIVHMSSTR